MTSITRLTKKLATKGDWCACCGCLVEENVEMIRISVSEGNILILKEHLLDWMNTDNADAIIPHRPRRTT